MRRWAEKWEKEKKTRQRAHELKRHGARKEIEGGGKD
jgi:hypothetical protein